MEEGKCLKRREEVGSIPDQEPQRCLTIVLIHQMSVSQLLGVLMQSLALRSIARMLDPLIPILLCWSTVCYQELAAEHCVLW